MSEKTVPLITTTLSSKNISKASCSTPEHRQNDSPSRDSDGLGDSDSASPINLLCTQDVDVVWFDHTPKCSKSSKSRIKNYTPVNYKTRKTIESKIPKRHSLKIQKKQQFLQELLKINTNLQRLRESKSKNDKELTDKLTGAEDDIFNNFRDTSPKNDFNFIFDDSTNEDLLKASQKVEEKILISKPTSFKTFCGNTLLSPKHLKPKKIPNVNQDLSDDIMNNIHLESPINQYITKTKNQESPGFNDSFDSFVGCLNDSALDNLLQKPLKNITPVSNAPSKDVNMKYNNHASPSRSGYFARHSSMPESPITEPVRPSTSNVGLNRYKSLPQGNENTGTKLGPDSSPPMRCTPEEIKKKHQQARERLNAKRLLPFTPSAQQKPQTSPENQSQLSVQVSFIPKKPMFQPKIPSNKNPVPKVNSIPVNNVSNTKPSTTSSQISNDTDIKRIIEKKRQEALLKLRRKQQQRVVKK